MMCWRRPAALAFTVLVIAGLVFTPGCGGPASPAPADTDCTGVTSSADPCDTSTARIPIPDLPELPCPTPSEIEASGATSRSG